VTPLIRSNLPGRIALRTKTAADGAIIMGRECAANYLLGRGDLIYDSPEDGYVRLQSLFVGDINKVKEIVAGLSEKYPNKNIFSRTKIAEKIDREKVYNSNDIIARTKAAMTNKSRIGEGLLTVTQAQTEEEVLVVIRLALLEEQNHVLLVIKLWGNLSDYPPGNAKCLMEKYSNLLKDCIVEIEKQGFSKSNNWGFSVENI
jgi:DNA segregation ATPase FtsK/SpoIIIE-like protein